MAPNTNLKISVICASNQNRSMEAHNVLKNAGYEVQSFGTGSAVRLPGPSIDKPNIYQFGYSYDNIYNELEAQDARLYTANGLLKMLDRNRRIKTAPERWQDQRNTFDIVITCEERCFDAVCEDLFRRGEKQNYPVFLINVDIKDNHEEASVGGKAILALVEKLTDAGDDLEEKFTDIMTEWQTKYPKLPVLFTIHYF
ncbi:phosphoric ester hydrolase Ssu72 [Schizosaccharomyces japonicus yFS275]|uniref:RNA polymerase II subunit A C-terminal domain phosphatase SSU72 n=1 Tax=Schizosaccharomyces japonicus (strain yFS275 / FY16936) TaxID=402676 RepID=B6K4R2_SCHJY|nr:phosphoric ester hydrolase Ssu72 [Schizosaccharomyces japonicus yFS275]EEB08469.1 phosphoric ester hydrolase Ssu72 [Schizosaccharomyces japonicus yFS275]